MKIEKKITSHRFGSLVIVESSVALLSQKFFRRDNLFVRHNKYNIYISTCQYEVLIRKKTLSKTIKSRFETRF